jgi:hypothetical protein
VKSVALWSANIRKMAHDFWEITLR